MTGKVEKAFETAFTNEQVRDLSPKEYLEFIDMLAVACLGTMIAKHGQEQTIGFIEGALNSKEIICAVQPTTH